MRWKRGLLANSKLATLKRLEKASQRRRGLPLITEIIIVQPADAEEPAAPGSLPEAKPGVIKFSYEYEVSDESTTTD